MQTNENPIWKCTYCFNRSCLFFSRMLFFCFLLSFLRQYLGNLAASKFEKNRYCFFLFHCFCFFHCAHLQKFDLFLRLVQQLMMIQAPLISFMIFQDFFMISILFCFWHFRSFIVFFHVSSILFLFSQFLSLITHDFL